MAGVSPKFQRDVAGKATTCPSDRAQLVFNLPHVVEIVFQNLENNDLWRARMINKVSNEVARKHLEKRILSNWITFPFYGCQQMPHLTGIPVLKATVPQQKVTPAPFTLRAYLPVGMRAGKAIVPARSLQIFGTRFGNQKNTWEKSCSYKKQSEAVFKVLSSVGQNLTSLRLDNVMMFPSMLVEFLSSTPNLKALGLSCLRLRNENDPDFDMKLALPPLAHLTSLKLGENSGTNRQLRLNWWLVKDYAGQLTDLELDAGRFYENHLYWSSPRLTFGKLERLRVYQLTCHFIFMVKVPTLKFLSMEICPKIECISVINTIVVINHISADSLVTLQLKVPWDFAEIFEYFSTWESFAIADFQCLTSIAVTDPHSYPNPDRRAVEACKILVLKSPGLKELHLLHHAVSLGTETAEEYLNRIKGLAQSERYWESSQTLEKIWIELELKQSHNNGVTVPAMRFIQLLVWDREWESLDLRNQQ